MLFHLFRVFKFYLVFILFQADTISAQNLIAIKTWVNDSGEHNLVVEKEIAKDQPGEYLSIKQLTKGSVDWVLIDYVNDCAVNIKLDVVTDSVEVNKTLF